jgi:hypothetical protein
MPDLDLLCSTLYSMPTIKLRHCQSKTRINHSNNHLVREHSYHFKIIASYSRGCQLIDPAVSAVSSRETRVYVLFDAGYIAKVKPCRDCQQTSNSY